MVVSLLGGPERLHGAAAIHARKAADAGVRRVNGIKLLAGAVSGIELKDLRSLGGAVPRPLSAPH